MQWKDLGTAIALMFVIEGIMPFLSPATFRDTLKSIFDLEDKTLRMIGLFSMIVGVILLYLVH